jgi:hypothetical protein
VAKQAVESLSLATFLGKSNICESNDKAYLTEAPWSENSLSSKCTRRCHIQHNDTQHNDFQHKDTQHNDIQHNDIQHNNTLHNDIQHNDTQHTQHNDIQHNDTQHNDIRQSGSQHKRLLLTLSINDNSQ